MAFMVPPLGKKGMHSFKAGQRHSFGLHSLFLKRPEKMPASSFFFAASRTTITLPILYRLLDGRYNTGISLFFTTSLNAGTSDAMICRHADNCWSSLPRN